MSHAELKKIVALKESLESNIEQLEGRKRLLVSFLDRYPSTRNILVFSDIGTPPIDPRRVLAYMDLQSEIYQCILSGIEAQALLRIAEEAV